jgi:hypothetical protein
MAPRLDAAARERLRALRAREGKILRRLRRALKAERTRATAAPAPPHRPAPQAAAWFGRARDPEYLAWLHEDLPCIACLALGGAPTTPIEAAHQRINAASRQVLKSFGVRPADAWAVPLCREHHRHGPLCCDPAQAKFWAIIGLSPEQTADFCRALHSAYQDGRRGAPVVATFAALARRARL